MGDEVVREVWIVDDNQSSSELGGNDRGKGILKGFVLPQYSSKNTPLSGDFKRKCVSAKKVTFGGVRKPRYRKGVLVLPNFL